ncbi:MAG: hypothetical protein R3E93_12130 [Thiothrix sp.]
MSASTTRGRWCRGEGAINHAASEFRRIQTQYGRKSVGGITSSRCTNEETWLVQKLIHALLLAATMLLILCASVPFADRLRPQTDAGRIGWHAGFRFGAGG